VNTVNAVIDIGYGYLKYYDEDEGKVQKEKAVVALLGESLTESELLKNVDILTVDGENYIVGQAVYRLNKKPITANESVGRPGHIAYKVLGLYALAKMRLPAGQPVVVFTGLPFINLDESDLVKSVFTGKHVFALNGRPITIEVIDTKVVSQGLGSFYATINQRGGSLLSKKVLLVDMGFRTINYMPLINGDIESTWVRTNRELGIQNAYIQIAENINREFKTNYQFYDVDDLLDRGVPRQDLEKGKYFEKITDKPYVADALRGYASDVWSDLINKYPDKYREEFDEVIFTGGTAARVETYLNEQKRHYCSFVEDSQNVQVLGYKIIADKLTK